MPALIPLTRGVQRRQRGVSLVEALVAVAVMGVGMLGLVGMQGSLRANSDIAKQRSEGVRLAQQAVEEWRAFSLIETTAGVTDYADLTPGTTTETGLAGTSTSFTRVRRVVAAAAPVRGKSLTVEMDWADRSGQTQQAPLRLATFVAGVSPELEATLTVPPDGTPVRRPQGRQRDIPAQALDLGDGRSGFKPPGAPSTLAWVFDNFSGLVNLCTTTAASTAALTTANISCSGDYALLLSGFVRFHISNTLPTPADAVDPRSPRPAAFTPMLAQVVQTAPAAYAGTVTCYADDTQSTYSRYYCAVRVEAPSVNPNPHWTGTLVLAPATAFAASQAVATATLHKACRYFALASPPVHNVVTGNLSNQNLLVIQAGNGSTAFNCANLGLQPHQPLS